MNRFACVIRRWKGYKFTFQKHYRTQESISPCVHSEQKTKGLLMMIVSMKNWIWRSSVLTDICYQSRVHKRQKKRICPAIDFVWKIDSMNVIGKPAITIFELNWSSTPPHIHTISSLKTLDELKNRNENPSASTCICGGTEQTETSGGFSLRGKLKTNKIRIWGNKTVRKFWQ